MHVHHLGMHRSKRRAPHGNIDELAINLWSTTGALSPDGVSEVLVTDFSFEPAAT